MTRFLEETLENALEVVGTAQRASRRNVRVT